MILVASIEQRYDRTPDGKVWTPMFDYSFWTRYLTVFEGVRVVARVRDVTAVPGNNRRADGDGVSFAALPYYLGPWQYLVRALEVTSAARNAIRSSDAVLLRVDSQIAACMYPRLRGASHPYGVEVVVDPYDVFSPGAFSHPLRRFFRWKFTRQLKQQCADACAAAYVTKYALQSRYPPGPEAVSTHYSSAELPDEAFVARPRERVEGKRRFRIITVAALEDRRKGHDVLFAAAARCLRAGLDMQLVLVGEGKNRADLEALAERLGLGGAVQFRGQLSTAAVRTELDSADVFVLPSRGEGLPRAAIEAMARALPAIGTTTCGYPELLPPEDLVAPGDAVQLAEKLKEVMGSAERMARMSARNLETAREYHGDILRARRIGFYRKLRSRTEAWLCRARG